MKLSVSLTGPDLELLDRYVDEAGLSSRSAGIQQAIRLLPDVDAVEAYVEAFKEWETSGDAAAWDVITGDGFDASR